MTVITVINRMIRDILNLFNRESFHTQSMANRYAPIPEPIVYNYIDPEYIAECLVDLESDFQYEIGKDKDNGLRHINIFHEEALDNRAQQIETLLSHYDRRMKLLQHIDSAIEKIKLEYPDFIYHIHYDMNIFSHDPQNDVPGAVGGLRKHGTQIFRITRNDVGRGNEGAQGVAGERYNVNVGLDW